MAAADENRPRGSTSFDLGSLCDTTLGLHLSKGRFLQE
jgi:hypothetical protein